MATLIRYTIIFFVLLSQPAAAQTNSTSGKCAAIVTGNNNYVSPKCPAIENLIIKLTESGRRLFVSELWLYPSEAPMVWGGKEAAFGDVVFVYLKVRNISHSPVLLTAGKVDLLRAGPASKQGGSFGRSILSPFISENEPIFLSPGAQQTIQLSQGLYIPGLTHRIESRIDLSQILLLPISGEPARINDLTHISVLNNILADIVGAKAELVITLYEGDYKTLTSLNIPISQGTDLFYGGENVNRTTGAVRYAPKFSHDAYLGEFLKRKERYDPSFHIRQLAPSNLQPEG